MIKPKCLDYYCCEFLAQNKVKTIFCDELLEENNSEVIFNLFLKRFPGHSYHIKDLFKNRRDFYIDNGEIFEIHSHVNYDNYLY